MSKEDLEANAIAARMKSGTYWVSRDDRDRAYLEARNARRSRAETNKYGTIWGGKNKKKKRRGPSPAEYWKIRYQKAEELIRRMSRQAGNSEFYASKAWQVLRYQALKEYGRKCALCGASETTLHVDHIKPRSKYPELELRLDNLQVLCADCNMGKGAWDESDWRKASLKNVPG